MKAKTLISFLSLLLIGISFNAGAHPSNAHRIYNRFVDDVVIVKTSDGFGTGVIFDDHILTCAHIVEREAYDTTYHDSCGVSLFTVDSMMVVDSNITIYFFDGISVPGSVMKYDHEKDLAEISVPILPLARSLTLGSNPMIGDNVFQIGHPAGAFFSYSEGKVMYPARRMKGIIMFQLDMTAYPGSSGSPIFNSKGELVGMYDSMFPQTSIGFAISVNEIQEFLDE